MDLSFGGERLCANTYAPHPRTVKVQSLSLFSPGANKPSALVSLVDILIATSCSSKDVSEKNGGASAFRAYFVCRFNVDQQYINIMIMIRNPLDIGFLYKELTIVCSLLFMEVAVNT